MILILFSIRFSKLNIFQIEVCLKQRHAQVRLIGKAYYMLENLSYMEQSGEWEMVLISGFTNPIGCQESHKVECCRICHCFGLN